MRIKVRGLMMKRGREVILGLGADSPCQGLEAEPLAGVQGAKAPEKFCYVDTRNLVLSYHFLLFLIVRIGLFYKGVGGQKTRKLHLGWPWPRGPPPRIRQW